MAPQPTGLPPQTQPLPTLPLTPAAAETAALATAALDAAEGVSETAIDATTPRPDCRD